MMGEMNYTTISSSAVVLNTKCTVVGQRIWVLEYNGPKEKTVKEILKNNAGIRLKENPVFPVAWENIFNTRDDAISESLVRAASEVVRCRKDLKNAERRLKCLREKYGPGPGPKQE